MSCSSNICLLSSGGFLLERLPSICQRFLMHFHGISKIFSGYFYTIPVGSIHERMRERKRWSHCAAALFLKSSLRLSDWESLDLELSDFELLLLLLLFDSRHHGKKRIIYLRHHVMILLRVMRRTAYDKSDTLRWLNWWKWSLVHSMREFSTWTYRQAYVHLGQWLVDSRLVRNVQHIHSMWVRRRRCRLMDAKKPVQIRPSSFPRHHLTMLEA